MLPVELRKISFVLRTVTTDSRSFDSSLNQSSESRLDSGGSR